MRNDTARLVTGTLDPGSARDEPEHVNFIGRSAEVHLMVQDFSEGDVSIRRGLLTIGAARYPLRSISSYRVVQTPSRQPLAWCLLAVMGVFAFFSMLSFVDGSAGAVLILVCGLVAAGALATALRINARTVAVLLLTSAGGEVQGLRTTNAAQLHRVAAALTEALSAEV